MRRIIALTICLLSAPAAAESLVGQASVIDGDTIEIHGERVRLAGMDAPESRQTCLDAAGEPWRCGQRAALILADLIGEATVACDGQGRDRYGRLIATCYASGIELGAQMVFMGYALAYRRYSEAYVDEEARAQALGLGLWSGTFDRPWDWRKTH